MDKVQKPTRNNLDKNETKGNSRNKPKRWLLRVAALVVTVMAVVWFCHTAKTARLRAELAYDDEYCVYLNDCEQYSKYDDDKLADEYGDAIRAAREIDSALASGRMISERDIIGTRSTLKTRRTIYRNDAKKRKAEEEKKAAEQKAEEEARRKRAEVEAALRRQEEAAAAEQRTRDEIEANYVEPGCYSWPPTSESITGTDGIFFQHKYDKQQYYGMTGWSEYDKAFYAYEEYAGDWLYHSGTHLAVSDGEYAFIQLTDQEVRDRLTALSQARRSMVIENTLNPTQGENPDDPFVYVTKSGFRYHRRKGCAGLNNANGVYVSLESDAKKDGLTRCEICY